MRVRRGAVWGIGAYKKNGLAYAALARALERDSFQDVIRSAVFDALAFMKEVRGIDLGIEWSGYGRPQNARIGAMGALGVLAKEHKGERERVIKHLTEAISQIRVASHRAIESIEESARKAQRV